MPFNPIPRLMRRHAIFMGLEVAVLLAAHQPAAQLLEQMAEVLQDANTMQEPHWKTAN